MRRSLMALTMAAALLLTACAPASSSSYDDSLPADAPLVAFYGDSYTRGTGASDPAVRWSTRISENRGWREFNPSVDGLGFVNNRARLGVDLPGDIIAEDPDIVIVTMGLNDAFSYDRSGEGIRRQMHEDFTRLSAELPDARIVVFEPFWYTAERPPGLRAIIEWVEAEADAIGADHVPGASTWIAGRAGEMAEDGLHPNDDGYDLLYERVDGALIELGL